MFRELQLPEICEEFPDWCRNIITMTVFDELGGIKLTFRLFGWSLPKRNMLVLKIWPSPKGSYFSENKSRHFLCKWYFFRHFKPRGVESLCLNCTRNKDEAPCVKWFEDQKAAPLPVPLDSNVSSTSSPLILGSVGDGLTKPKEPIDRKGGNNTSRKFVFQKF